jgi:hypothetical protein
MVGDSVIILNECKMTHASRIHVRILYIYKIFYLLINNNSIINEICGLKYYFMNFKIV